MEKGIIYKWKCLVNNKEYIGQTNIEEKRKNQFIDFEKRYAGNAINNARKKYNNINQWQYSVIDTVECENAELLKSKLDELEIYYIAECNTKVPYGYNITDGGGGIVINGSIGYWNGKSRDEDTKRKIGNANRGTKHSRESIERAVRRRKDNPNYDEIVRKSTERLLEVQKNSTHGRIKVYQYNKKGELVSIYNSITEASEKMLCSHSAIASCVNGEYNGNHKNFKGFLWSSKKLPKEYIQNYFKEYGFGKYNVNSKIYVYDNKINLLKIFSTQVDAANFFGVHKSVFHTIFSKLDKYGIYKKYIVSCSELNKANIKKICKFNIDGELLDTYYDVKFIPKEYDKNCIRKCLRMEYGKKKNFYKKFYWKWS